MDTNEIIVRVMTIEDYDGVSALWKKIQGFGIRNLDDSREYVHRFLLRNPTTSVVAEHNGEIIGSILCGHDGRQACFYHVCVDERYRQMGIGRRLVDLAVTALKIEHINRVYLTAFKNNTVGNTFWKQVGWEFREDRNYYELYLTDKNATVFNQ